MARTLKGSSSGKRWKFRATQQNLEDEKGKKIRVNIKHIFSILIPLKDNFLKPKVIKIHCELYKICMSIMYDKNSTNAKMEEMGI